MKKLSILLVCLLLLLTGCSNSNKEEEKKEETVEKIDPLEHVEEDKIILTTDGGEKFELSRIESTNRSDADALLQIAVQALEKTNLSAEIRGLYFVPTGLAGNIYSYDPIMIKTDSDDINSDPLFMTILMNEENKFLLGTFRESDLTDKNYRNGSIALYENLISGLYTKLGLSDEDVVNFDITKLIGLDLKDVSNDFKKLYNDAAEHYSKVMLAMWDGDYSNTIQVNGMDYPEIIGQNFTGLASLNTYLQESFTKEVSDAIMAAVDSNIYTEVGGKLYYAPIGMGGNIFIQSIEPKLMADNGLGIYMIVECEVASDVDSDFNFIGIHKEDYLFEFVKENDFYKCSKFIDIPFGMFEY